MSVGKLSFSSFEGSLYADRLLIESSPFPMVELEGPRLLVRDANKLFCRMIAQSKEAIVGKPYAVVVPDLSSVAVLDRVYRSGVSELHGEPERIENAPETWAYTAWPVLDATKTPLGVVMQVTGPTLLQRAREINEALMISVVHQHERTDIAEALNVRLEAEIAERKRAEVALLRSEEKFRSLVAMSSDWYWEQDENFRFTEVKERGQEPSFVPSDSLGKTRWELPLFGVTEGQWAEHREQLRQHRPFRNFEFQRLNAQGETIWISINGDPVFDDEGQFCGYRGTGRDISYRKRHQEQIELIMREVSHREKNLMSLVIAVARQTAKATPEKFVDQFSARLQSMAVNLDLLVQSQWQGIEIDALVHSQLAHFQDLMDTRIRISGPTVRLKAQAAQIIGMALHELATNAAKYGSLTNDSGVIELAWRLHERPSGRRFAFSWIERGGPMIAPPEKVGFGSTVVTQLARAGLDAEIELEFPSTGLRWNIDCPAPLALEAEQGS